jgi:hypothetical protein
MMDDTLILVFAEALLDSMRETVEKRRQMTGMLEKAEQGKQEVNDRVYQNVMTDYRQRLSKIDTEYQPLRQQMNTELQRIRIEQQKVQADLEVHRENLEEAPFRFQVGEFSEEELRLKEQNIEAELQRMEDLVATANLTQNTAKELLGNDIEAQQPEPEDIRDASPANPSDSSDTPDTDNSEQHDATDAFNTALASQDNPQDQGQHQAGQVEHPNAMHIDILLDEGAFDPPDPYDSGEPIRKSVDPATAEPDDDATELMTVAFYTDSDSTQLAPPNEQPHQILPRSILRQKQLHDGSLWEITSEGLLLGRNPRCDVVINDPNVSRHHAVISMESHFYYIEDTSSGGGVRINDEAVSKQQLSSGDEITIGEQIFIFHTETA